MKYILYFKLFYCAQFTGNAFSEMGLLFADYSIKPKSNNSTFIQLEPRELRPWKCTAPADKLAARGSTGSTSLPSPYTRPVPPTPDPQELGRHLVRLPVPGGPVVGHGPVVVVPATPTINCLFALSHCLLSNMPSHLGSPECVTILCAPSPSLSPALACGTRSCLGCQLVHIEWSLSVRVRILSHPSISISLFTFLPIPQVV